MRLIDADALKEDIKQQCALLRLMKDNDELTQISMVLESGFMAQIDKMPTIEPERKKGKWIDGKVKHIENGELRNVRECSECGSSYFVYDNYNSVDEIPNYCPNCGADMRKTT